VCEFGFNSFVLHVEKTLLCSYFFSKNLITKSRLRLASLGLSFNFYSFYISNKILFTFQINKKLLLLVNYVMVFILF